MSKQVEYMSKHLLSLATFREWSAFLKGAFVAEDSFKEASAGKARAWVFTYNRALENPEVQQHVTTLLNQGLCGEGLKDALKKWE